MGEKEAEEWVRRVRLEEGRCVGGVHVWLGGSWEPWKQSVEDWVRDTRGSAALACFH